MRATPCKPTHLPPISNYTPSSSLNLKLHPHIFSIFYIFSNYTLSSSPSHFFPLISSCKYTSSSSSTHSSSLLLQIHTIFFLILPFFLPSPCKPYRRPHLQRTYPHLHLHLPHKILDFPMPKGKKKPSELGYKKPTNMPHLKTTKQKYGFGEEEEVGDKKLD